jgi:hypothetical protein
MGISVLGDLVVQVVRIRIRGGKGISLTIVLIIIEDRVAL